jgi:PAS domain S-box-containing protein
MEPGNEGVQQQVEHRLRVSEGLFAATLNTLAAAISVLDEHGHILLVNTVWGHFEDPTNAMVYGLGLGADYASTCQDLAQGPDDLANTARGILAVIHHAKDEFVGEYRALGSDTVRWYATTVSRFISEGETRILLAHREMTDRKRAEDRMRQSELMFRLITDNAMDLITLTEMDGTRLYYSPSYHLVLGYSKGELDAQGPMEIVHPEDREKVLAGARAIALGQTDAGFLEYRLRRRDGSWGYFEARQVGIPGEGDAPMRLLFFSRDITERRMAELDQQRLEVQLRHAQKLESIGNLAAGIAHEINTPTQYIGNNLQFIHEELQRLFEVLESMKGLVAQAQPGQDLAGPISELMGKADLEYLREELPKAAEQSLEGVARVAKIVGAMKEFSHPGTETKTPTDLNRAIESTVTVSRNEWKYVADLDLELDPTLPLVPCLPGEINQVVLNLVVNAAHAIAELSSRTGAKGRIVVRTRKEDEWAVIQVEDTGTGIPEAIRSRIFDPFFTTKGVGKGSGQGLAIVHSVVVRKHSGRISFETTEGQGTLFTVQLPLRIHEVKP